MNCEQVIESGAYALGILDEADRAAYERHLTTCAICRAEVAGFSGLPGLLAQLDPDQVAEIGAAHADVDRGPRYGSNGSTRLRPLPSVPRANPAEEFVSYDSRVSRGAQRRRRRWQAVTAGLAAAACLAVGVLVGAQYINDGPRAPSGRNLVAMRPVAAGVPINAQLALDPFLGGTEVRMHCVYDGGHPAPRWTIKLLVYPKDGGAPEQVSTWTAAYGDDLTLTAATHLPPASISRVELRKGDDTSLLVYDNA